MPEPGRSDQPLRVGVLLDALVMPAWIAGILRQLLAADFAEPALLVLNGETPPPSRPFDRLRRPRRDRLLFNLYERVDAHLFRGAPDAFALEDLSAELAGVPAIVAVPSRPKPYEHRFAPEVIGRIREAELDVALRFGFNIIRGEILDVARYGVWSYHHGDHREYRGLPAFFWEMYERSPVCGTMLQVLGDDLDAGHVLYRSFSATDPLSLHRGRSAAYWKSAQFVLRCLRTLRERGWEHLAARHHPSEAARYGKPIYRTPTNGQMARFLVRTAAGAARRRLDRQLREYSWHVGYRPAPADGAGLPPGRRLGDAPFRLVEAPSGRWYADPMVVEEGGAHHLFLEDYDVARGRGVISWAELRNGSPAPPQPVLALDRHLSYPFLFRWDGAWHLIPETRASGTVELWRAAAFPERWERVRVLLQDVDAVDGTALVHDGRFHLFVNLAVPGASVEDELFLFQADSPYHQLRAHPLNPIVSDVRRARPAGAIFRHEGSLVRPSQDCSLRYGGATVFNRITALSSEEYAEEAIARLEPDWLRGNLATHTFNADSAYQVVDAQRRELKAPLRWGRRTASPPPSGG